MSSEDYQDIAKKIAEVIVSPESVYGAFDGVLSVPKDFGYLVYGYFDTDTSYARSLDKERILRGINKGIYQRQHIEEAIKIGLDLFNERIPNEIQNHIYSKLLGVVSGRITGGFVASRIVIHELEGSIVRMCGGISTGFILFGGTVDRCCYASKDLMLECPELYYKYHPYYYDLLYFLIKPILEPFVKALSVYSNSGQSAFNEIIKLVEIEVQIRTSDK